VSPSAISTSANSLSTVVRRSMIRSVSTTVDRGNGGSGAIRAVATASWKARRSSADFATTASNPSRAAWTISVGVGSIGALSHAANDDATLRRCYAAELDDGPYCDFASRIRTLSDTSTVAACPNWYPR
jgi:hypothetical protein